MAEQWIRMLDADGDPMFLDWSSREGRRIPAGAVTVDRKPRDGEDYTPALGWHIKNPVELANYRATQPHIEEAHLVKYLEAVMVKSGVVLTVGILVEQANMEGTTLDVVADAVIAKRVAFQQTEVDRQRVQVDP